MAKAVFSFKTRIEDGVEFDEDIKGCCMVSESEENIKLNLSYSTIDDGIIEFKTNISLVFGSKAPRIAC